MLSYFFSEPNNNYQKQQIEQYIRDLNNSNKIFQVLLSAESLDGSERTYAYTPPVSQWKFDEQPEKIYETLNNSVSQGSLAAAGLLAQIAYYNDNALAINSSEYRSYLFKAFKIAQKLVKDETHQKEISSFDKKFGSKALYNFGLMYMLGQIPHIIDMPLADFVNLSNQMNQLRRGGIAAITLNAGNASIQEQQGVRPEQSYKKAFECFELLIKLTPPTSICTVKFMSGNIQPVIWGAALLSKFYKGEYDTTANSFKDDQKLMDLQHQLKTFFRAKGGTLDEVYKLSYNLLNISLTREINGIDEKKHLQNIVDLMEPLRQVINQNEDYLQQHHLQEVNNEVEAEWGCHIS